MEHMEENNIVSLRSVRASKNAATILVHLKEVVNICDLSTKGLRIFQDYLPVRKLINAIETERTILAAHMAKQEQILKEHRDGEQERKDS